MEGRRGLSVSSAHVALGEGLEDSFAAQAAQLTAIIAREEARSIVFADLMRQIEETRQVAPIIIYLGKNSCGFVDSFLNWTMDVEDLMYFPVDPVVVDGQKVGFTQGEILVHILEERWMMEGDRARYHAAHLNCFAPSSFQNRYRRELGHMHDAAMFDVEDTTRGTTHCDFIGSDRGGWLMTVPAIPVDKCGRPRDYVDHVPSMQHVTFVWRDFVGYADANVAGWLEAVEGDVAARSLAPVHQKKLAHWIEQRHRDGGAEAVQRAMRDVLGPPLLYLAAAAFWRGCLTRAKLARTPAAVESVATGVEGWRTALEQALAVHGPPFEGALNEITLPPARADEIATLQREANQLITTKRQKSAAGAPEPAQAGPSV